MTCRTPAAWAAALLLLLAALPSSQACDYGCINFPWQTDCKRTKAVYNEIINLSRSAGRDKLYQLTLGLGLPIVGTSGKCTAQNALVCGYVKDTLKKLSSPTDYTYTCVRRYVLDMLCNSQLNADGEKLVGWLLKTPKISDISTWYMRANADGVANSIKGYFSYMNSMNKLSQFYNAATC